MSQKEGKFYIGIGAIIENIQTGHILLLHRSPTVDFASEIWDDVGGRMYQFEKPEETLLREVQEETGITEVDIIKPLDVSHYYRGGKSAENAMIVITYWCTTSSSNIVLSSEHDEHKWVSPKEALLIVEDENLKRTISRFLEEKR